MKSIPLVSVIVAVRNAESSLDRTLQSLIQQTTRDFEIVLIDGASIDGTLKVAEQYRDNIACLISEPDSCIADAWNKGVQHARGRWIMFLNAGDLIHRDHLKRAASAMQSVHAKPTILFCDVLKFNASFESLHVIKGKCPSLSSIAQGSIGFAHPGSICSSDCFDGIGLFDTNVRIALDTDWLLRGFKLNYNFCRFVSVAYMAEGGLSSREFDKAMVEYFSSTTRLGLTSKFRARLMVLLLPHARKVFNLYRSIVRIKMRNVKHIFVSVANFAGQLLPFYWLRLFYFRLIGFNICRNASIGVGFKFYWFSNLTIGEGTVINRSCLFDNRDKIYIGAHVSIARGVSIFTAGHDTESPFFEMTTAPVYVDNHAVVFANAMIMPGVHIGTGAVVYSGSVVTKDVEPYAIVGGVPARVVGVRNIRPNYSLKYLFPLAM